MQQLDRVSTAANIVRKPFHKCEKTGEIKVRIKNECQHDSSIEDKTKQIVNIK